MQTVEIYKKSVLKNVSVRNNGWKTGKILSLNF